MESASFTIHYKGEERELKAVLRKYGYIFRIQVEVESILVEFEPDEEGRYRALVEQQDSETLKQIDTELLRVIAEELQEALG